MIRDLSKPRAFLWALAAVASLLSLVLYFADQRFFFQGYLQGYLLWLGISLGCLGIWILHGLVGGQWGDPIGPIARAAASLLPLMAVLFIPVLLGMRSLFPWTDPGVMAGNEMLARKIWYLNTPFFIGRVFFYFSCWLFLVRTARVRSEGATRTLADPRTLRLRNWSARALLGLFFTGSFAAIDWIFSIEPFYYSTIAGALILISMLLGAFAFSTLAAILFHRMKRNEIPDLKWNDLGNLLLMSVVLWMYFTFSQYLITWAGQIRAEVSWYNNRFIGGWQWFGGALLVFNFFVPFGCLLFRRVKRSPALLSGVALLLLAMQWVQIVWLTGPAFSPMKLSLPAATFLLPIAIGSLWLASVATLLNKGVPPFPRGGAPEVAHYGA